MDEVCYQNAIDDLARAGSGGERSEIVRRLADRLGVTVQSAYRGLQRRGWSSGRAPRSDRGRSALSQAALEEAAAMTALGRNKRGMANLPATEAHRLAQAAGHAAGEVSYGHLARRLRQEGLSLRHINAPEFAVARVSTHPNQVHFFDISVAIQWYFRDGDGRKLELYDDAGERFYEGKVKNFQKLQKVVHRFLLVDHYSGARYGRYYYTTGERAEDVVDFLWRAWSAKGFGDAWPFRGLPELLVMDQGSANKSALVRELLTGLGVRWQLHRTKNAKASGAVESGGHLWTQRSFEGWLTQSNRVRDGERFAPNLETLNQWAEEFFAVRGATVPHTRHGRAPLALWASGITAATLREAPPKDVFFGLAVGTPQARTVDTWRCIEIDRVRYQLTGGKVLHAGAKVTFRLAPWTTAGIRVWDSNGVELAVERIDLDAAGFPLNGTRHVFLSENEDERGSTAPVTPGQRLAEALQTGERPAPQVDTWGALHRQLDAQRFETPVGQPWAPSVETLPLVEAPRLVLLEVVEAVRADLGRRLTAEEYAWLEAAAGEGIAADELGALKAALADACAPLREVG